ncbi:hypothetical protein T11_16934 [Trichinella zimbabwensis]|uniref:Uncharacterized protein n=1 Tax=Trichinella zimbabwensis TaxID=268475 RepID=A0A0V1HME4_9BILA|nr:hypothetical protein T11_16934 [Trichinella zimbabwensis]
MDAARWKRVEACAVDSLRATFHKYSVSSIRFQKPCRFGQAINGDDGLIQALLEIQLLSSIVSVSTHHIEGNFIEKPYDNSAAKDHFQENDEIKSNLIWAKHCPFVLL